MDASISRCGFESARGFGLVVGHATFQNVVERFCGQCDRVTSSGQATSAGQAAPGKLKSGCGSSAVITLSGKKRNRLASGHAMLYGSRYQTRFGAVH
ncbi:hypothetical protein, partial [Stieleria sp.]|uniref:hypothetical protein n=1 Tax=Stieleria sp. TaxID=2795976 RepID=UPI0035631755